MTITPQHDISAGEAGCETASRSKPRAPARAPLLRQPASPAVASGGELDALRRIDAKLRQAGATLPAPAATGTVEGAIVSGLCIALCLVEAEITSLEHQAALAAVTATMTPDQLETFRGRRAQLRQLANGTPPGAASMPATRHNGIPLEEIAELLADLKHAGARADGELIGICAHAGAVIIKLLASVSPEQRA